MKLLVVVVSSFRNWTSWTSASKLFVSSCSSYRNPHCLPFRHFGVLSTRAAQVHSQSQASQVRMSKVSPPGVVVNWDFNHWTKEDLMEMTEKCIAVLKEGVDQAVAGPLTYEGTLKPMLQVERKFRHESEAVSFPGHVAVSQELRDASRDASKLIEAAVVEVNMRVDLFQKLCQLKEALPKDSLSVEETRALDKLIRDGKRNGLNLPEEIREEIKKIKNEMNDKAVEFSRNLAEDKWAHYFTASELEGLPASFLEGLEKNEEGNYKVTLQYPHLFPITKMCKIPETRKLLETANCSKAMDTNGKILEEMILLRQREASLLGYKNHSAFVMEELMASNPTKVETFLRDLSAKLQPLWDKEREYWLQLKKEEFAEKGWDLAGAEKLEPWDTRYYMNMVEEKQYAIDHEAFKQYFPVEHVTKSLLDIYQKLLHLKFTKIDNAPVWHEEVEVYEVKDSRNSELMGYFYLDLYPRDGKYTHACCVPLQPSCNTDDGMVPTAAAMLCNFTKPTGERPALLTHNEVETFFHEFGHVMHCICSRTETIMFSGAHGVEKDFVECPSQMLENWVWHKTPLALMSKHYQTGESLPQDMVEKLVHSQKANAGAFNLRQVSLALFDQKVHAAVGPVDTGKIFDETLREVVGMPAIPGTNFAASFGHLAHGYSARYYSYLWSEVYSMDMYETVFGDDVMSPDKGLLYREKILQPGGSLDGAVLLRNFLGRDPVPEPFLRSKGIDI